MVSIPSFFQNRPERAPATVREKLKEFRLVNGILLSRNLIYILENEGLRRDLLALKHDAVTARHPGRARTLELMTRDYWWPSMTKYIHSYVDHCDTSLRTKVIN